MTAKTSIMPLIQSIDSALEKNIGPHGVADSARRRAGARRGRARLAARAPCRRRAAAAAAAGEARRPRRHPRRRPAAARRRQRHRLARHRRLQPRRPDAGAACRLRACPASARCASRRACISWTISIRSLTARCWRGCRIDHALRRHLQIRRHRRDADADHRRALCAQGGRARPASPISSSASASRPSPASPTACAICSAQHHVPMLDHDPGVGGRFSVLTNVGLLPAAMLGLDIARDPRGRRPRWRRCWRSKPPAEVPAALGAALAVALAESKGKSISVLMAYADRLERFTRWYVQLWAESLGKDGKGTTPLAALGPVDQHSQLQLFIGGPRDKLFTVVTVDRRRPRPAHRSRARRACRRAGLRRQDHRRPGGGAGPRHRRDAGQERLPGAHHPSRPLDEASLGELLMHFMLETIIAAHLSASMPSTSRRSKRARCWRRSIWRLTRRSSPRKRGPSAATCRLCDHGSGFPLARE